MTVPLLVVAAGGLARETLEVVRRLGTFDVLGMLDDDASTHDRAVDGVRVVGGLSCVLEHPEARIVVCAGRGSVRRALVGRLGDLGVDSNRFVSVIDPGVHIPSSCTVGEGSVILAGTVLTTRVNVGRHVVLMPHVTLTHDDSVDDFATLCASVVLGGSVRIDTCAYVGMGAAVREGCVVGAESTVGMGAVVLQDVPSRETWVGVPARPVATRRGPR